MRIIRTTRTATIIIDIVIAITIAIAIAIIIAIIRCLIASMRWWTPAFPAAMGAL